MLDVLSPVPLQEGESLVFGISTKHVGHALIGVGFALPVALPAWFLLPLFGLSSVLAVGLALVLGIAFAIIPLRQRTLAEVAWLALRYAWRPRVVLYDREYRIRTRRREYREYVEISHRSEAKKTERNAP
ncbi:MAG: hypothetical protein ACYCYO_00125 [Bacilli bacterium]